MAAVEFVGLEPADEEWMTDAACKGLTHLFFPSSAERPQARERREAMARQSARPARCGTRAGSSPAATTSTASGAARARTSATPPATA